MRDVGKVSDGSCHTQYWIDLQEGLLLKKRSWPILSRSKRRQEGSFVLSSVGRNTKDIFVNGRPEAKLSLGSLAEREKLFQKQYLFCIRLKR